MRSVTMQISLLNEDGSHTMGRRLNVEVGILSEDEYEVAIGLYFPRRLFFIKPLEKPLAEMICEAALKFGSTRLSLPDMEELVKQLITEET